MNQAIYGQKAILDAATGRVAVLTRNGRRTTSRTAAMGGWEDSFKSIADGLGNLASGVGSVVGAVKGVPNVTYINPSSNVGGMMQYPYYGQPQLQPYAPYAPTQPTAPVSKTNNTLLYTGLGVAAFAALIFLKK